MDSDFSVAIPHELMVESDHYLGFTVYVAESSFGYEDVWLRRKRETKGNAARGSDGCRVQHAERGRERADRGLGKVDGAGPRAEGGGWLRLGVAVPCAQQL